MFVSDYIVLLHIIGWCMTKDVTAHSL